MRKLNITTILLITLALLRPAIVHSQTCEPNHKIPYATLNSAAATSEISSTQYNMMLTFGQPIFTAATNLNQHSLVAGFWAHYLKEPRPPIVRASDGDFQDKVYLEWTVEGDRSGPPVTGSMVTLYRNGQTLTSLPVSQTDYQDFNVFPGEYYQYGVTSSNDMGESHREDNIGFMNPNGVITGNVKTPSGNPVLDTKVMLTPNLGQSAFFDDGSYIYFFDANTSANRLFSGLEGDYTIETWFRSVTTQQQTIFAAVDSATTDHYILIELTEDGKLHWQHNPVAGGSGSGSGSEIVTVNSYTEDSEWHHVAVVFDNNDMTMYVDAAIVGHTTASAPIDDTAEIILGKKSPLEHEIYLHGRLDDFRIWKEARSWENIRNHNDLTLSGEEWNLASYWKFDEVEGDIIFDLTDNDNDGNICHVEHDNFTAPVYVGALTDSVGNYAVKSIYYAGGTTFTVTPQKTTSIGRSLEFDGVSDYISFKNQRIDLTAGYTIEGWFKTSAENDQTIFAGVDPGDGSHRVSIETNGSGNVKFSHYASEIVSAGIYNDELWHHYAVTYDSASLALFVDGAEEGTAAATDTIPNLSEPVIARQAPEVPAKYFDGYLDEIRVWSNARTYEQIGGTINQTLAGDNYGLINYWRINEGSGDLVNDDNINQVTGTIQGASWTEDIPLNEVFTHIYQPESRQATLNNSNTSVDKVDFTDISMIAISGYVRYENTACMIEGAMMLLNGKTFIPPIYTDDNGKYIVEIEPGSTGDIISCSYKDHAFIPPFIELPMIARPITGLYFNDKRTYDVSGKVAGGSCEYPITPSQGQIEVTFTAVCGCYDTTTVPNENTGLFEIKDLPPLIYQVTIDHPDPEIDAYFTGDTLSLEEKDRYVEFIYRSLPEVTITGFPTSDCGMRVMAMLQDYTLNINVFESYVNFATGDTNSCAVDSGTVVMGDLISDTSPDTTYKFSNGHFQYTLKAGKPNLLSGGDHPYQKNIQATITDPFKRVADVVEWTLVTGNRPRETFYATTSPEVPLMIVHAPPGDGSFAYWSSGTTIEQSIGFSCADANNTGFFINTYLGVDVTTSVGLGATVDFQTDVTIDMTNSSSMTMQNSSYTEQTWTYETTETISTVTGGDVFIGGAINILYGITDELSLDDDCNVVIEAKPIIVPAGFATNYVYSEKYISDVVIPSLRTIEDDASADRWESYLAQNEANKASADLVENRSFDAGTVYEFEHTETITETTGWEMEMEVEEEFATAAGIEVNGVGVTGGVNITSVFTTGESGDESHTTSNTFGYTFADDDIGDAFTVDIMKDNTYGSPVFNVVSGASSCPYEAGTVPYDGPSLSVTPPSQTNVAPDEAAVFNLIIGNASQMDADREYWLRVINASNPDGAMITVNGIIIEDHMSYFIPAGEAVNAVLGVYRGLVEYEYDNIQMQLVSPCQYEWWENGFPLELADTVTFSVHFIEPCSESHIVVPEDNWLITGEDAEDTLWVTVDGYDWPLDESLTQIELRYRPAVGYTYKGGDAAPVQDLSQSVKNIDAESSETAGISSKKYAAKTDDYVSIDQQVEPVALLTQSTKKTAESRSFDSGTFDLTGANRNTGIEALSLETDEALLNEKDGVKGGDWFIVHVVPKDSLKDDYVIMPWNISPAIVVDGAYELQAVAVCTGGLRGISNIVTGIIDRAAPELLGAQSPADGILDSDDEIAITFNEDIECGIINPGAGDIKLFNTVTSEAIDFTFTCGGNTIIINLNIQNMFIENQTLRAEVSNIEDVYGNHTPQTFEWEFFVNRNPIEWTGGGINDVVIYIDQEYSTTRQITNTGGSNRSFTIIGGREGAVANGAALGLPSWLNITPLEGTLTPGNEMTITIELEEGLNFGEYRTTAYAAGTMGDEPLTVDIRKLCYPPDWELYSNIYQYSMTITATLSTDGELSADTYDIIAAFVDGEIRGITGVEHIPEFEEIPNTHPYEVFLTIYSNDISGESIDFRVWDASECMELGMIEEFYTFEANLAHGTPTSPVTITATSQIISQMPFFKGWNWFSLNLENPDMSVNSILQFLEPANGDLIKSQTQFDQYVSSYGWVGTLDTLDNSLMYLMKLAEADTMEMIGYAVDVEKDTINIVKGWNWIGYTPQQSYDINRALGSLEAAATGDLIKSQYKYSQFVEGIGWLGSLKYLDPKLGYRLYSYYPGELLYPYYDVPLLAKATEDSLIVEEMENPTEWTVDPTEYQYNMTVTGIVEVNGSDADTCTNVIAAFVDGECRGVAMPQYIPQLDQYMVFMMIYSNQAENEMVEFKFYDAGEDIELYVENSYPFEADKIVGSVEEPVIFVARALRIGDSGYIPEEFSLKQNYPNPFNPVTTISFGLPEASDVVIDIYNIMGQKVRTLVSEKRQPGYYFVQWNCKNDHGQIMPTGMYIYRMQAGSFQQIRKMVLLK